MPWTWPTLWSHEKGGFWRLPLTLFLWFCAFVLGLVIFISLMSAGLRAAAKSLPRYEQDILLLPLGILTQHALPLLALLLAIRLLHNKPINNVFKHNRPFGIALALQSAAVYSLLWLAGTALSPGGIAQLTQHAREVPLPWWPPLALVTLAAITLQSTHEEVLFRGYLLPRLSAWLRHPLPALLLTTLLFTVLHTSANLPAKLAIASLGIAFSLATIRTNTLAPAIGMHAANNTLNRLCTPTTTNAQATWLDALFLLAQVALWLAWLYWATRSRVTGSSPMSALKTPPPPASHHTAPSSPSPPATTPP